MYFRMFRLEVMINRKRLWLLILASVGVALVMGVSFYAWYYIKASFGDKIIPSFWDQLAYFYRGIPPFTPSRQESFEMPIAYLITNLVLLFALGNTTVSVFEPYGYELFTRVPKRTVWWLAHCLLAVMAAVAEQVVITGTIAVLCLAVGGSFSICDYIGLAIPEIVSWPGDGHMQVVSLLLSPLLTTIALALLQIVLELVAGDTVGLLLAIAFPICKDFLTPAYQDLLIRVLHATLILCPSYSVGSANFELALSAGVQFQATTLWGNSCSALYPCENTGYTGAIRLPNIGHEALTVRFELECEGKCSEKCAFLIQVPLNCAGESRRQDIGAKCTHLLNDL